MKFPRSFLKRLVALKLPHPRLKKRYEKILGNYRFVTIEAQHYKENEETLEFIKEYLNYKSKYENIFTRVWKAIVGSRKATANEFVSFLKGCSVEFYTAAEEKELANGRAKKEKIKTYKRGW